VAFSTAGSASATAIPASHLKALTEAGLDGTVVGAATDGFSEGYVPTEVVGIVDTRCTRGVG
jgi:hypothetical protein